MLNDALYQALGTLFGEVPGVASEGAEARFSCPPMKMTHYTRKTKRSAVVSHWGESYRVNCPICGDKRQRLFFSHLYGMVTKQNSVTYHFGNLWRCQNEKCDLRYHLRNLQIPEAVPVAMKPTTFIGIMQEEVPIPNGCLPLGSADVPAAAYDYLHGRRFDPAALFNNYLIMFAPKGTEWWPAENGEPARVLYEDRLLIPVIQGRRLVGYQLRRLEDRPKDKYKYLNAKLTKSKALYNRDVAMFCRDVVLVEGVTDVWRVGRHGVGLFGKDISPTQLLLMKSLWGFSGRALLCLDADDAAAQVKMEYMAEHLRREKVFPRGVGLLRLPVGYDPATIPTSVLDELEAAAWQTCC